MLQERKYKKYRAILLGFCQRAMTSCIRRGKVIAPGSVIYVLDCLMYHVSKEMLETHMARFGKREHFFFLATQ